MDEISPRMSGLIAGLYEDRIPIKATAREPIKLEGYISATSAFYAQSLLRNAAGPYIGSKGEILAASRCFLLWPQQRTSLNSVGMSVRCRYCCKSRKSNNPKSLAKADLWTSLLLRRFSTPLRRPVIDFG
jgi:hypothetical protein